ncbi:MAG: agmatinase, partial [Acidimicrobiales bacterium]|nr:agmatinase [Acidimicrobiales bacterium]
TWTDGGDVDLPDDPQKALPLIREAAATAASGGAPIVSLGGDHAVTWPLLQHLSDRHKTVTIVHFDAHPDLYDELDGSRLSHACPFARIMEEGLATRLLQFGIRTMTRHQAAQVERFGVEVHTAAMWDGALPEISGPVYVSIDMDALDPAFAPGVSHHEPGGLTTRQILNALHLLGGMDVEVVGADLVELNPDRDLNGVSAMVAAKLVRELLVLAGL